MKLAFMLAYLRISVASALGFGGLYSIWAIPTVRDNGGMLPAGERLLRPLASAGMRRSLLSSLYAPMSHPAYVTSDSVAASVDGGRDAVGRYLLGLSDDPVYAEFSLEAKCCRRP